MKKNAGRLALAVISGFLLVVLARGLAACSDGESAGEAAEAEHGVVETAAGDAPEGEPDVIIDLENTVCPVMGGSAREDVYADWNGFRVHFCCAGCDDAFLSDPESYLGKLAEDPDVAEKLAPVYP